MAEVDYWVWIIICAGIVVYVASCYGVIRLLSNYVEDHPGIPARGARCPWTAGQIGSLAAFAADCALAYGFVQNYEGWHNDVQHWFHVVCVAVFLGLFLRIVGWPQSYKTFERSSEATPGEGEKLLPHRVNVTTEKHFWYWCARCQEFVKGKHRYHCKTCMRCSTGFDHHCHYLNTCINDANYTAWFVMCFAWLVVLVQQLISSVQLSVDFADEETHAHERLIDDMGAGAAVLLLVLTLLVESFKTVFFLDLITMHVRFMITQQFENCKAAEEQRVPAFISTYKMLGFYYADEEKQNKLETALLLLQLRCQATERAVLEILSQRLEQHRANSVLESKDEYYTDVCPITLNAPPACLPEKSVNFEDTIGTYVKRTDSTIEAEIKEVFHLIQVDGSDYIEPKTLKLALDSLGMNSESEHINKLIQGVDSAGTGKISLAEFSALMSGKKQVDDVRQDLLQMFRSFDRDNSGTVTVDDLVYASQNLGKPFMTRNDVKELVAWASGDNEPTCVHGGSGLSQDEFVQIIMYPEPDVVWALGADMACADRLRGAYVNVASYHESVRERSRYLRETSKNTPKGCGMSTPSAAHREIHV